ncbi:MAG TPA: DUF3037 domain-containing protein [Candidatus Limnocylindrales bacterium]
MSVPPDEAAEPGAAAVRRHPFEYAIVRVMPRVERGEAFNAGIVLHSRSGRFLGAKTLLDAELLVAMSPDCDPETIRDHLTTIERIAAGDPGAGPIAALSAPERWHWLASPSSTVIQPSEIHTGLTADPQATLDHLFRTLVER